MSESNRRKKEMSAESVSLRSISANSPAPATATGPRLPRRVPSQARSVALVDAILEASTRVFDLRGFDGATTNEMADVAGVSVGSLYQYFPDKLAILTALHEQHVRQTMSSVAAVMEEALASKPVLPLREVLRKAVRSSLDLHTERLSLQRVLHQQYPHLAYPVGESAAKHELLQLVTEWLQRHASNTADTSELDVDWLTMAETLLTMAESLVHSAVLGRMGEQEGSFLRAEENIVSALAGYLSDQGWGSFQNGVHP
ncbi:TetR/AcrR family transcriptional regulator [Hydrogenophaga sp. 5NK40-0174]|uniref:TetR/AcrR family transcriptional regulator n=1 Tax=Hydrogenophaga sp. 5NK40-0174 TaxID=3127649 RepID=UPI003107068E